MTDGFSDDFAGSLLRAVSAQLGVELKRGRGRPRNPVLTEGVKVLASLRTRGRTKSDRPRGKQEEDKKDDANALAIAVAIVMRDTAQDQLSFPARTRATELAALRIFGLSETTSFSQIRIDQPEDGLEREMLKLQARLAKKLHPDGIMERAAAGRPPLQTDIYDGSALGKGITGHPLMKLSAEERRALLDDVIERLVKTERQRLGLGR